MYFEKTFSYIFCTMAITINLRQVVMYSIDFSNGYPYPQKHI